MVKNKEMVAAEVYQAVGVLLDDAGRFDTEEGQTLLDACSFLAGNRDAAPTKQLLPFLSKEQPTAAQQANRLAVQQTETLRKVAENRSKSIVERGLGKMRS